MTEADNSDVVFMVIIFSVCFNRFSAWESVFAVVITIILKIIIIIIFFLIIIMYSIYSVMGGGNGWGDI